MDLEPQKFFIGVIDFFSILLPGALLTYLLKNSAGPRWFGARFYNLSGTEGWVIFLFSSYLVGHFVFLLGSSLLDDRAYDPIRKGTFAEQVRRLANSGELSPKWARWLAGRFLRENTDHAVRRATKIKEHYLGNLNASSAINTFQWSKAKLRLEHPDAMATVERFEADSKFFRSLVIVLLFLVPWGLVTKNIGVAITSFLMLLLAFWRYVDQRVKATNQAYWYIITLESQREGGYRELPNAHPSGPSHAGGVVFKRTGEKVEYLLVQAKNSPHEWVLPKGHIEPGEEMKQTAVREVREETGVWARIQDDLGEITFTVKNEIVNVRFYGMEELKEGRPVDRGRKHVWLPLDKAQAQAFHKETRQLLSVAEHKRTGVPLSNSAS